MSVVFGANFIEGVILVSDSRSTQRRTGLVSDTATKIVPVRPLIAVGVTGNPTQAGILLSDLNKKISEFERQFNVEQLHGLTGDLLTNMMKSVGEDAEYATVEGDPRCRLIFAGVDPRQKQTITMGQVNHFSTQEGNMLIPGMAGANLFLVSQSADPNALVELPFPSTYLFSYTWPMKKFQIVRTLNMEAWGSGSKIIKEHTEKNFHKLWRLDMVDDTPWFKPMIFAVTLKEAIEKGADQGIGGLAQIVSIDVKRGVVFQGYSKNAAENEIEYEMRYENGSWIQRNGKGEEVKTLSSFENIPNFSPEEIVNWLDKF